MTTAALFRVAPTSSTARKTKLISLSWSIAGCCSMVAIVVLLCVKRGVLRSALDRDCLEVGGGDRDRVAMKPVEPAGEVDQVVLERVPGGRVERREGMDRRPVP